MINHRMGDFEHEPELRPRQLHHINYTSLENCGISNLAPLNTVYAAVNMLMQSCRKTVSTRHCAVCPSGKMVMCYFSAHSFNCRRP